LIALSSSSCIAAVSAPLERCGSSRPMAPDAIQATTENPYRLARDIRGVGFKTADAIANKLGIEKTAMMRVRAGISYALTGAMDEGHCGWPTEELGPLAEKLLEVPRSLIRTAFEFELQERTVIADRVGGWQMARCLDPGSSPTRLCRGSKSASVLRWPRARPLAGHYTHRGFPAGRAEPAIASTKL
jgi:hypothetical protein